MTRETTPPLRLIALAFVVVLAGCGASAQPRAASPAASPASYAAPLVKPHPAGSQPARAASAAARPAALASVAVRTAPGYGRLLVDGKGQTLYLFTADHGPSSACNDACATAWPPLILKNAPRAGPGIKASRLTVIHRRGGQLQAAYYGHPLYYYVGDRQPGQINCQDAEEFGGHWWLVQPTGAQNRSTP